MSTTPHPTPSPPPPTLVKSESEPAPTIASLPPADQFDEALGRLRDIAEWLGNLGIAERTRSEFGRSGVLASLSDDVDDAANRVDRSETLIRETVTT